MKTKILLFSILFLSVAKWFAADSGNKIECTSNPDFDKNTCDVCFDGGLATVAKDSITLESEYNFPWKNSTEDKKQIFYRDGQGKKELITNYGSTPETWLGKGIMWDTSITWGDNDGQAIYTLDMGKEFPFRMVEKNTIIPLEKTTQPQTGSIILKIPVSYYELDDTTFSRSDVIKKNYCVSYVPKLSTTTQNTTTNTNTATTSNTNTNTQNINNTTTATNNTTSSNTSSTSSDTTAEDTNTASEETNNTIDTNEEIPAYNAKVTLNSAGTDPLASEATHVATGPAENMLVLMAAILLSLALFPKINALLNK